MSDDNRVGITVRLRPDLKDTLFGAADKAGFEQGVAARLVLERMAERIKRDGDFLQALLELKRAWAPPNKTGEDGNA